MQHSSHGENDVSVFSSTFRIGEEILNIFLRITSFKAWWAIHNSSQRAINSKKAVSKSDKIKKFTNLSIYLKRHLSIIAQRFKHLLAKLKEIIPEIAETTVLLKRKYSWVPDSFSLQILQHLKVWWSESTSFWVAPPADRDPSEYCKLCSCQHQGSHSELLF